MIYHPDQDLKLHITGKMFRAFNRATYLQKGYSNTPADKLRKHISEGGGHRWMSVSDPEMAAATMPLFLAGEIDLRIDGDRTICARFTQPVGKDGLIIL